MTYTEWINKVKAIMTQLDEGCIVEREAFNAILARAIEVEQIDPVEGDPDYVSIEFMESEPHGQPTD